MTVTVNETRRKRARRARAEHIHGCRMQVSVREFGAMPADEPAIAGGTDTGPTPLEYVTSGLAACQLVTVVKLAEAMGFAFSALSVEAETDVAFRAATGEMSPVPRFTAARMVVQLQSDEPDARRSQLIQLVEERCPVSKLFADASLPVEVEWR